MRDVDEYEDFLTRKIAAWSADHKIAFSAAMVERWLHTYEKFAAAEQWGDAANLGRMLDALWRHVLGTPISAPQHQQYVAQLHESTPHMDDFDAYEALATCMILLEALDTAATADKTDHAVRAALSGFEAAVRDWAFDPEDQPQLWRKVAARNELKKQLKLVERIEAIAHFDTAAVNTLRKNLTRAELVGKVSAPAKSSSASAGITNQTAFEQYRSMVTADLKQPLFEMPPSLPGGISTKLMTPWMARYSRRQQTINGSYGKLADAVGMAALCARNLARDITRSAATLWDSETSKFVGYIYDNPMRQIDAASMDAPHGYGPSARRLWIEAIDLNQTDQEALNHVIAWARHVPAAWAIEDQRKKKGSAYLNPLLGEYLGKALSWTVSDDPNQPWQTEVEGRSWRVRLNDFPDDLLYTLLIDDQEIGPFHDWPANWQRS